MMCDNCGKKIGLFKIYGIEEVRQKFLLIRSKSIANFCSEGCLKMWCEVNLGK